MRWWLCVSRCGHLGVMELVFIGEKDPLFPVDRRKGITSTVALRACSLPDNHICNVMMMMTISMNGGILRWRRRELMGHGKLACYLLYYYSCCCDYWYLRILG